MGKMRGGKGQGRLEGNYFPLCIAITLLLAALKTTFCHKYKAKDCEKRLQSLAKWNTMINPVKLH